MKMFSTSMHTKINNIKTIITDEIYAFHPVPCKLLDDFGLFVQAFLAIASFSVLIAKRAIEHPQRSWKIWFMDVSKQGFTACTVHLFNLMFSEKFGREYMNQCNWYFVNLIADVFIGTCLNIMSFKQFENYLSDSEKYKFTSGDYGPGVSWREWFYQSVIWVMINYIVKFFMLLILFMNLEFFSFLSSWILAPFEISARFEIVYIMVLMPTFLNGLAFWMTDTYLKEQQTNQDEIDKDNSENSLFKNSKNTEKSLRRLMTT